MQLKERIVFEDTIYQNLHVTFVGLHLYKSMREEKYILLKKAAEYPPKYRVIRGISDAEAEMHG